jgi:hypothetical protein
VGSEYKLNRKVGEKLISNGISLPQLFLTSWYRFANYHLYQVEYHFNPEIYGFGPQERATWLGSSWHPSAIWNDPIKNSFKDVVLKWTKDHYDFVKSAAIEELRTPDYRPRVKGNYRREDLGMGSIDFNAGRRLKRIGIIVKDDKNVCDSAVDRATLNWSTKNTSDVYTAKDLGYSVLDCLKLLTDTRK